MSEKSDEHDRVQAHPEAAPELSSSTIEVAQPQPQPMRHVQSQPTMASSTPAGTTRSLGNINLVVASSINPAASGSGSTSASGVPTLTPFAAQYPIGPPMPLYPTSRYVHFFYFFLM